MRNSHNSNRKKEEIQKKISNKQDFLKEIDAFLDVVDNSSLNTANMSDVSRDIVVPPPPIEKSKTNPHGFYDIITVAEHPYFLNQRLTPWQKLMLKLAYMGSTGNTHLVIEDHPGDNGCEGCIWIEDKKNLTKQYEHYLKDEDELAPIDWIPMENAQCLTCTRLDCKIKDLKYAKTKESCSTEQDLEIISNLETRELTDNYYTEKNMLDNDLSTEVTQQVKSKLSNKFTEIQLVVGRRSGKDLSLDTPILTKDGWKTMEDIRVNDVVYGNDGKETNVIAISEIFTTNKCYEISFNNGEKIIAGENHDWIIGCVNKFSNKKVSTKDIFKLKQNKNSIFIKLPSPIEYKSKMLLEDAYYFGFSLGHNFNEDNLVVKSFLNKNKSKLNDYIYESIENRLNLIKGLIDSKNVSHLNSYIEFKCDNAQHLDYIHHIICSLGIRCFIKNNKICFKDPFDENYNKYKTVFIVDIRELEQSVPTKCIQVDNKSHTYLCGKSLIPTHNSFLASIISLYSAYQLLCMDHPQKSFRLLEQEVICILNVAKSANQAEGALFVKIKAMSESSPYFTKHIGKSISAEMYLLTEFDKRENLRREKFGLEPSVGTIRLLCGHSQSETLVGLTCYTVTIDEMAVMAAEQGGGVDYALYTLLKPTLATFGREGKIVTISNPMGPIGLFFELYNSSFKVKDMLMLQLPTWLVNPMVPQSFLDSEKQKFPIAYDSQYGAQFATSVTDPWIPPEYIIQAFEMRKNEKRKLRGDSEIQYFLHMDPAYSSDHYALALVHAESTDVMGFDGKPQKRIIIDHIHYFSPDGPKGNKIPIDITQVDNYILNLIKYFNIAQITYDHFWGSEASVQRIKNMYGIPVFITAFNPQYKSLIYTELYNLFTMGLIEFYGINTTYTDDSETKLLNEVDETKREFLSLQRVLSHNRYNIQAAKDMKDDIPDCVASATFQALKSTIKPKMPKTRVAYYGLK